MSWHEFAVALHESDDHLFKVVLLAIVVSAAGVKKAPVDFKAIGEAVGRSPTTLENMRPQLQRAGWLERHPIVNESGRPAFEYVTARSVG